jgi:hypothetical protein
MESLDQKQGHKQNQHNQTHNHQSLFADHRREGQRRVIFNLKRPDFFNFFSFSLSFQTSGAVVPSFVGPASSIIGNEHMDLPTVFGPSSFHLISSAGWIPGKPYFIE